MSEEIAKRSARSRTSRRAIAERINAAFEAGDIAEICHSIGAATSRPTAALSSAAAAGKKVAHFRGGGGAAGAVPGSADPGSIAIIFVFSGCYGICRWQGKRYG
jgi:hypothetical protein